MLVVAEVAMALMLCLGGGLLIRSVVNLSNVDLGYDPTHVLTAQVSLPRGRYAGSQLTVFADDIVLETMLFGLTPVDPTTFVGVALIFGLLATLAAYVPAHRAAMLDPLVALRRE